MAYVPEPETSFVAAIAGDSGIITNLCLNDRACQDKYSPGLESNPYPIASTAAREFRFRWRRNLDNNELTVAVRAVATGAAKTVTIATPGVDSTTVAVTVDAWYSATLQATGPDQEVVISLPSPAADTVIFTAIRASANLYSSSGSAWPSGYRHLGLGWGTDGYPLPSEVVSRLRTNPIRLAIDRPVCVACHISDTIKTITTKSAGYPYWGAVNSTSWALVGRMVVPKHSDSESRWYRVDAYTVETVPGTAEFKVRIGATDYPWTGPGWHSWRVLLGPGEHPVLATIKAGNPNQASIRTLQVWRSEL